VSAQDPGDLRSLRSLVNVVLAVTSIVVVLGAIAGAVSYQAMVVARGELADELDPAVQAAARLHAAASDQQSGVRGFSFTADPEFMEPWVTGREDAQEAIDQLRRLLEGRRDLLAQVDEVARQLREWQQEFAEVAIERAEQGQRTSREGYAVGRSELTEVRDALAVLEDDLAERRAVQRAGLDDASVRLALVLLIVLVALVALVAAVWLGLRRAVLAPVDQMVDDAGRIAVGDLDHVPQQVGLRELAELGRSLDHVRDALVTQLREVERREADLARSNAELEQFAYVASHDLQEPLRKVASFCQMLERRYKGQLDERADTYISFAVDGATRMQDLINDLLAFSRVGRTTDRFDEVDLQDVFDAALRNLSSAIEDAGAEVRQDPLPTMVGDRSLLVALFQNLVGNGIKFRGVDPPCIEVRAVDRGDEVELTVSDNGIGIPEEYRDRIFVIFQRLHGREEYPGTGIGLSLCRKIVEFHGGRIEVADDDRAAGTTIRFTLRRDLSRDAANGPQKAITT
jgi:signal transduction histidine kinase